jgi:hypothetical protein
MLVRIECAIPLERGTKGCYRIGSGQSAEPAPWPSGRVPRVARLLALAHKFEGLVQHGTIADYATLARLGHVSRARVSQLMNLLQLAPDIQEQILFLSPTVTGRDRLKLRDLQPIAQILDWHEQRVLWRELLSLNMPQGPRLHTIA